MKASELRDPDTLHMFEILEPKNVRFWPMMYAGMPENERPEPVLNYYLRRVEEERARLRQIYNEAKNKVSNESK